jgi:hypothetical protein
MFAICVTANIRFLPSSWRGRLPKNGVDSVSGGRPFSRARQHAHSPPVLRPTELSAHSIRASSRKGSRSHSSWTSQFSRACYAGLVDVSWQHGSGFQEVSWQQDSGIQVRPAVSGRGDATFSGSRTHVDVQRQAFSPREVSWQQPVAMALCERLAMYFERSSSLTVSISSMNQTSERCPHLLSYSATHSVPAGAVAAPAEI